MKLDTWFPEKALVSVRKIVADEIGSLDRDRFMRIVRGDMRHQIADFIVNEKMTIRRDEGNLLTVYQLDVIVMSPEEFAGAVHNEARRLTQFFNQSRSIA